MGQWHTRVSTVLWKIDYRTIAACIAPRLEIKDFDFALFGDTYVQVAPSLYIHHREPFTHVAWARFSGLTLFHTVRRIALI